MFALYAVPYELESDAEIRLVAIDDVGNRTERAFVDRLRSRELRGRDVPTRIPVFTRAQRARLASKDPGCGHERTLRVTGD